MAKKKNNVLLIILGVIVVVFLAKDFFIKLGVETGVRAVTGLPLKIDKLHVGLTSSLVDIKGLKLYNPRGFKDKVMVSIPEIYVDYKLSSIFKGKIEITDLRLHLEEIVVVKNKDGELNLDQLKTIQQEKKKKEAPKDSKKDAKKQKQDIQINNLSLKVERALYKDYTKGDEPAIREYKLGIDQSYSNIKSLNALVSLIVARAIAQTALSNLVGVDLSGLSSSVSDSLKGVSESTSKMLDNTSESIKESTEELKGLLKNPFGKE